MPPFSLLFNVLVNPALASAHAAVVALITCDNPFVVFRLVVSVQPIAQYAEAWAVPRLRALFRKRAQFAQKRGKAGEGSELPSRLYLLAASTAGRISKTYERSPRRSVRSVRSPLAPQKAASGS